MDELSNPNSLMLGNNHQHTGILQSQAYIIDNCLIQKSSVRTFKEVDETENKKIPDEREKKNHSEHINDALFCSLPKKIKSGKSLLSSSEAICLMKTSSGGDEESSKLHSRSMINPTRCLSLTNYSLKLEVIAEAILYMAILASRVKMSKTGIKASKLFNEPSLRKHNTDLYKIRSQPITSCNKVVQVKSCKKVSSLTLPQITQFLKLLHTTVEDNEGMFTQMLYYLIKIMSIGSVHLNHKNWKPLLFTSFHLSGKYIYDAWYMNNDFAEVLSLYECTRLNSYERKFLRQIQYLLYSPQEDISCLKKDPIKYIRLAYHAKTSKNIKFSEILLSQPQT
ncbi:unnamed protein product [Moneuplotes crassus]|uniref:Uncharacterized protein n=1 Tax=Euplotes crassus TaxID=5936 RepID=A0AAD2D8H7_EUPCR|nr:unnamed protein product [Moneuplotes crassus]